MFLEIKLNQSEVTLKILKNRRVIDPALEKGRQSKTANLKQALFKGGVDSVTAKYYHDLSEVLINSLDKLLKRNKLDLKVIKSHKIQGNLGTDSTSHKIATAFVAGLQI